MKARDDITEQLIAELMKKAHPCTKTNESTLQRLTELYTHPPASQELLDAALLICSYNFPLYVPFFLDLGADPNTQDDHQMNALQAIIERDGILFDEQLIMPCIQKLISSGVNLHHLDICQHSALYYAVESNYCQIARFLLEKGCSVKTPPNNECLLVTALNQFARIMHLKKTNNQEDDVRLQPIWKNPGAMVDLLLEYKVDTLDTLFSCDIEWAKYQQFKKNLQPDLSDIKFIDKPRQSPSHSGHSLFAKAEGQSKSSITNCNGCTLL